MKEKQVSPKQKNVISRRKLLQQGGAGLAALSVPALATAQRKQQATTKPMAGEVAFITGGARGIGRATAIALAKQGAHIAFCDIAAQIKSVPYPMASPDDMQETVKLVKAEGVQCLSIVADVRDSKQMKAAVQQITDKWGRLDMMVANAGILNLGGLEHADDDAYEDVIQVNVIGLARSIKAAIPAIKAQGGGRIVTVASIAGRGGMGGGTAYGSSKWAVIGITKGLAQELGRHNITVNAVCPTIVNTPMVDNDFIKNRWSPNDPTMEGIGKIGLNMHTIPLGMVQPEDIANAIAYFCGPEARYVSGVALDVAAGATADNNA